MATSTTPALTTEVRRLTREDIVQGADILSNSLIVEPGYVALIPDDAQRFRMLTTMYRGMLMQAIRSGTAWGAFQENTILGVAGWRSPGSFPASKRESLSMLPVIIRMLIISIRSTRGLFAEDRASERYFPQTPVWYLQALGVTPETQGQGIGSKLLVPVLEDADTRGESCYLETGTIRNVRFYKRFGFEVRESAAQLVANGPTHWTMIRHPHAIHR